MTLSFTRLTGRSASNRFGSGKAPLQSHFDAIAIKEDQIDRGNEINKNPLKWVHHCSNPKSLLIDAERERHQQAREVQP